MKVLSITSSYPRYEGDPTAPFIESITRHIAARGHSIHLVVPEHHEWRRPPVEDGVHFHPYRYSPRRDRTPWGYSESLEAGVKIKRSLYPLAPLVAFSALRACNSLASREAFDLVHAHWVIPNGPIGAVTAQRHDLPLVISLHGSDVSVAQRSRWIGRLARESFARAAAVTAPSEDLLERARSLGATTGLELVPYGADPEAFRADPQSARRVRERLDLGADDVVVLGIGRFVHWKGFDDLIEAVAQARRTTPSVRLVFVGDGDLRDQLRAKTEALGLGSFVTFVGIASRGEVPAYFAAADVVAVPSVHYDGYVDGLPNVGLEAMAAGKPVIATRVGGLPSIVRDGENGLLVDERNPVALAEAIVALATDAELRQRMGENGRAQIVSSLNWNAVAARFVEVYERARDRSGDDGRARPPVRLRRQARRRLAPRDADHAPASRVRALYFGTYERDYPRNAQVMSCLRNAGVEVQERHVPVWEGQRHKFALGLRAVARSARAEARLALASNAEADVLIVGYPGHVDMAVAKRFAQGRPVVFNPLVSLEETMIDDRGLVKSRSAAAKVVRLVDRQAFRRADLVVADTDAHSRYFIERFDLSADSVAVCYVGAEDRLFQPGERPKQDFHALFVGKLIPLHGVETILRAAALCPEIEFHVVGSGQLDDLLSSRPANVRWEKWVAYESLPELYRSAGCALGIFGTSAKASRVIPNKAFQALATETPLITADTPAARELLAHERDALLVPPRDPAALAAAVRRLAADTVLRDRIAAHGRMTYEAHATEEVLGHRWRSLLEQLLS